MLVSVVVPVYNLKEFIKNCLDSLLSQTIEDYEIIVIDDGSTDATEEFLKTINNPKIKVIYNPQNKGPAYSRNRGIKASRGEFIAITDSDCIVEKNWLKEIIRPFSSDPYIMISGGKVIDPSRRNYWERVNKGSNFIANKDGYIDFAYGCNMAFRKEFLKNNPFDESLRYAAGEEFDLCLRCKKQGFKIYYSDNARVMHYHRIALKSTLIQHFRYGFANNYVCLKNRFQKHYLFYFIWLGIFVGIFLGAAFLERTVALYQLFLVFVLLEIIFIFNTHVHTRPLPILERMIVFPGFLLGNVAESLGKLSYFVFLAKKKIFR